jgi:hypothetical protein
MKFFCPLEINNHFVLSAIKPIHTKQNNPRNPEEYTQTTLMHERVFGDGPHILKSSNFNHFYMYICCLLNSPKRSRAIFAMAVFGVILMLLAKLVGEGFLGEETTLEKGEYTLLHGVENRRGERRNYYEGY